MMRCMLRRQTNRREAGFSFIEILVVMAIISVLATMVVVVVPMIQEKAKQTKSKANVGDLVKFYQAAECGLSKPWPGFNGKNFVLWLVAYNHIDRRRTQNLDVLFSPGDTNYTKDKVPDKLWETVTPEALKSEGHEDFKQLTSYAGRRNREKLHMLTSSELSKGAIILCDDDDGPLHHAKGLVVGYSGGDVRFMEWSDLNLPPPTDEKDPKGLLGDPSPNEELKHVSSDN